MKNNISLEKLKDSPIFNLSLSSKELFHSNFLNWLIGLYKEEMSKVFSELINESVEIETSLREKHNFDLLLKCKNKKNIIIENKFKSIISKEQLVKYDNKIEKNTELKGSTKILLTFYYDEKYLETINDEKYLETINDKKKWLIISYKKLIKILKDISISNEYHKDLVLDYCNFVEILDNNFSDIFHFELTLNDIKSKSQIYKEYRLHDIYQKIIFSNILIKLKDTVEKSLNEKLKYGFEINNNNVSIFQDFYNGTGLASLIIMIENKDKDNKHYLEVQFQSHWLRLMLAHYNLSDIKEPIKDDYFEIINKRSKSTICHNNKLYPINKQKKYNNYTKNLIYKNIKLKNNLKVSEIIELLNDIFQEVIKKSKIFINN